MLGWIIVAVVIATALFLFMYIKMKNNELNKTQQLLLQFIDQFETQYDQLSIQLQEQKDEYEAKYMELKHIIFSLPNAQREEHEAWPSAKQELAMEQSADLLQLQERYNRVIQLWQDGKTIDQIARICGKGKGEVQLILELLVKPVEL